MSRLLPCCTNFCDACCINTHCCTHLLDICTHIYVTHIANCLIFAFLALATAVHPAAVLLIAHGLLLIMHVIASHGAASRHGCDMYGQARDRQKFVHTECLLSSLLQRTLKMHMHTHHRCAVAACCRFQVCRPSWICLSGPVLSGMVASLMME